MSSYYMKDLKGCSFKSGGKCKVYHSIALTFAVKRLDNSNHLGLKINCHLRMIRCVSYS